MKAIEKAKLALKAYLLANKDQVVADLDNMRKESVGNDIFNYIEELSDAFSFENVTTSIIVPCDLLVQEIDHYKVVCNDLVENSIYSPPNFIKENKIKKGSENIPEPFF